jgi:putative FmdB family regulatory protein
MPTYEYACKQCGEHLEVVQSFTDDALTTCPACGGALRKVFGSVGIVFKGSGFYKTDSRSGTKVGAAAKGEDKSSTKSDSSDAGSTPAPKADKAETKSSDSTSTTKSESKPAAAAS